MFETREARNYNLKQTDTEFKNTKSKDLSYSSHENDDPETAQENKEILSKIPFACVGSDKEVKVGGKTVRGRQYPWGVIDIENEEHCDFNALRKMLIRTHMEEVHSSNPAARTYFRHSL
jgi:septin family protein